MTQEQLRACPYYHLEEGLVRETALWFHRTITDYESDENDFKSPEGDEDVEMLKAEFNKCFYIYCTIGNRKLWGTDDNGRYIEHNLEPYGN